MNGAQTRIGDGIEPNLKQPDRLPFLHQDRHHHDRVVRAIAGFDAILSHHLGPWIQDRRLIVLEDLAQHSVVRLPAVRPVVHSNLCKIDLALELEKPLGGLQPDGTRWRFDAGQRFLQHSEIQISGGDVAARHAGGRLQSLIDLTGYPTETISLGGNS